MDDELKTPQQVRREFDEAGISIGSWAKANGFQRERVYSVLDGRNKAKYGEAHKIAVALGLKKGSIGATPTEFLPVRAHAVAGAA